MSTPAEDLAHVEALARQRRQLAQKHGDDHRQASWFAVRLAVEDIDGTGRPGTDAEVLAAVRALAQDDAAEDARVVVEIGRLLEERD